MPVNKILKKQIRACSTVDFDALNQSYLNTVGMGYNGRFNGAQHTKALAKVAGVSDLNNIMMDQQRLTQLARRLATDDPYVRRILTLYKTDIAGCHGFTFVANVTKKQYNGKKSTTDENASQYIEDAWEEWSEDCLMNKRRFSLNRAIYEHIIPCLVTDGEVFIRKIKTPDGQLKLHIITTEYLGFDRQALEFAEGDNDIINGVEIDEYGCPVAYHFYINNPWSLHPRDQINPRKTVRVPAEEVIHLVNNTGIPDEKRGYSILAPIIKTLIYLEKFQEASVAGAVVAASQQAFFKQGLDVEGNPVASDKPIACENLGVGQISVLPAGWDLVSTKLDSPHPEYGDFISNNLKTVAAAVNVSYAALSSDLSEANFSSTRFGKLVDDDIVDSFQNTLKHDLLCDIYEEFLKTLILNNDPMVTVERYEDFENVSFIPKARGTIDEIKEATADTIQLQNATTTRKEICARNGKDFDEVVEQLKIENEKLKDAGIDPNPQQQVKPPKNGI